MPLPTPTPAMLAAGERRLMQAARSKAAKGRNAQRDGSPFRILPEQFVEAVRTRMRSLPRGLFPVMAVSGSLILLFACVVVGFLGAGTAWRSLRSKDARIDGPTVAISEGIGGTRVSPLPTPTPTASIA